MRFNISTLLRIANSPAYPDVARFDALLEMARQTRFKPRPTLTPAEVLSLVMNDERVDIQLRIEAAKSLLALLARN